MNSIHSICVFCGSSSGSQAVYSEKARALGILMARRGISLVYGGSNIGIMRVIADTILQEGGEVIGVMPRHLIEREVAHREITRFHEVETMAERKAAMADLSDAFITLPGGIGTLDELFEVMSWNQLEIMDKPVALYNIDGYYDQLVSFLDHTVQQQFVKPEHRLNLIVDEDEYQLLEKILHYVPVKVDGGKWIKELRENSYL